MWVSWLRCSSEFTGLEARVATGFGHGGQVGTGDTVQRQRQTVFEVQPAKLVGRDAEANRGLADRLSTVLTWFKALRYGVDGLESSGEA